MTKKIFWQGFVAGILASIAALIYNRIYFFATETNFTRVVNTSTLIAVNMLACMLAATGFWLLTKWLSKTGEVIFNFLFSILSFASVILPISVSLPLEVKNPELFPGLAVPMHFFPALAWFTIRPIFVKE